MNNTITPETESIINIVEKIEHRKLYLCLNFKEIFVWDISRTMTIYLTILKDVFIGSIILTVSPLLGLTVRELHTRPRKGTGMQKKA